MTVAEVLLIMARVTGSDYKSDERDREVRKGRLIVMFCKSKDWGMHFITGL